jgi:hypothetical protein
MEKTVRTRAGGGAHHVIFSLLSDTKCRRVLTFVDQVQGWHRDVLDHLTPG